MFKCSFVGAMTQNLTGGYVDQGLHGTFGPDVGPLVDLSSAQAFAALTLRTQATQVAAVSTLPAYVDGRPVFLTMEDAFQQRQFTQGGGMLDSLGLCAPGWSPTSTAAVTWSPWASPTPSSTTTRGTSSSRP